MSLWPETLRVSYLDDSSLHEQMVRFATAQLRAGHLPLTGWFPYLGLGSPHFLHYQSLPATLAGLAGVLVGPDAAFRWTLYLLLSLWPVSVYVSARLFGAGRWAAAASAALAPFLVGAAGIGYEQGAYVWNGYGVWSQLWASMTLPLAWGLGWRAVRDGRGLLPAVAMTALTAALHFETGYLAFAPLVLWPLVAGAPVMTRVRRAATVAGGALLATAWVIVPLLQQRAWAATNEELQGTASAAGYGAGRVLGWLGSGQLLDHGRLPVVTALAGIGLVRACVRWRTDRDARALVAVLGVSLLLSFGPATFGAAAHVIPGAGDLFFRRFMMGVQLAALLLAGSGAAWAAGAIWRLRRGPARLRYPVALGAAALVLVPACIQLARYDMRNAAAIHAQRRADATEGADVDKLLALVAADGGGRVYAGLPTNWGNTFTVGTVPVFKYLESRDVDEVGYTMRTASLMTNPESNFDELEPADYDLFAIHYLILPAGLRPPVRATLAMQAGAYCLWTTATTGYIRTGSLAGELAADRTNLGARSIGLLRSTLARHGDYLRVAYGRPAGDTPPLPDPGRRAPAGTVTAQSADLDHGTATATVAMQRAGITVLSASFDPGWTVTVDGHPQRTLMVAPALVATHVPPGAHTVAFRYRGYSGYPWLFALCGLTLAVLASPRPPLRRRRTPRRAV